MLTYRLTTYRLAGVALAVLALALPATATAHERTGGAASLRPQITSTACERATVGDSGCPEGEYLALRGEQLADVARIVFLGKPGKRDDRQARSRRSSPHRVLLRVPVRARSGRVRAITSAGYGSRGGPRLVVASAPPAEPTTPVAADGAFPVQGKYDFGSSTNAFGGGRGHQGQDLFASCGTPVVAARPGTVVKAASAGNEGNYAVVEAADGTQQAYLHMRDAALVSKGGAVAVGQAIGKVGETGNAVGCHLHFEIWTSPGRFTGGTAIDPRPDLERWAAGG